MNSYLTFQLISSVFLWYQSPTTTPFFAIYIYFGSWAWRGAPPRHAPNVIIYIYIYNNQIFFVQSVVSRGRNQRRGHNKRRFGLSCVRIVYFLRKSLDFHFMRTHCQIIIYKLLLPIYNKSPSIAKHRPLTIFLLPVFTHSLIAPRYLPNHSPVKSCFSLPSIFWYYWVDGDADRSSSIWTAEAVMSNFFLASEVANLNTPSNIAFPDPVTYSVNEPSKIFSLKIHQANLSAPTHQIF